MSLVVSSILTFTLALVATVNCDFTYPDFNQTLGLVFNGDASISSCSSKNTAKSAQSYPDSVDMPTPRAVGADDGLQLSQTVESHGKDDKIPEFETGFGDRSSALNDLRSHICSRRLRLTTSAPSKAGSVFYEKRVPVLKGFDTTFSFQITDHSRVCSEHVHPMSLKHHRTCVVHGGDGLAFIIHSDEGSAATALGGDGKDIGYGGISNSIAIEFDTWTNVDTEGSDDFFHDHISIHSGSTGKNSPGASTALGYSRPVDLADGKVHTVRVMYQPYIDENLLEAMTINENLVPFIKDNGPGRRLGTLVISVDSGIEEERPVLAIPLNLSVLLNVEQSLAYVGFTASTGKKWEKHDILTWDWCDSSRCNKDDMINHESFF